jgi:hypothetical protein
VIVKSSTRLSTPGQPGANALYARNLAVTWLSSQTPLQYPRHADPGRPFSRSSALSYLNLTWLIETVGQVMFWRLYGPAPWGLFGMGVFVLLAWRKQLVADRAPPARFVLTVRQGDMAQNLG